MKKIKIFLIVFFLAPIIAGLYGVVHDQITYSISSEYFTKFKYDQFGFDPQWFGGDRPTVALIGFLATWWTGVPVGLVLGVIGFLHQSPTLMLRIVFRSILLVLAIAAFVGFIGFIFGYFFITKSEHYMYLPDNIMHSDRFILVGSIHNFSYLGGVIGLITAVFYQLKIYQKSKTEIIKS